MGYVNHNGLSNFVKHADKDREYELSIRRLALNPEIPHPRKTAQHADWPKPRSRRMMATNSAIRIDPDGEFDELPQNMMNRQPVAISIADAQFGDAGLTTWFSRAWDLNSKLIALHSRSAPSFTYGRTLMDVDLIRTAPIRDSDSPRIALAIHRRSTRAMSHRDDSGNDLVAKINRSRLGINMQPLTMRNLN